MGLNFKINNEIIDLKFSYGSFHDFRIKIANKLGYKLEFKENFDEWICNDYSKCDKFWWLFLTHNDYTGFISHKLCGKIAIRMRLLIKEWDIKDNDYEKLLNLIEFMKFCKKNKTHLIFC